MKRIFFYRNSGVKFKIHDIKFTAAPISVDVKENIIHATFKLENYNPKAFCRWTSYLMP